MEIKLAIQSYQARAQQASSQRCVNLYVEKNPDGAKGNFTLYGTPGLSVYRTLPAGNVNNMIDIDGVIYAVGEDWLYKIDGATITNLGYLNPTVGRVSMSRNNEYLVIIKDNGEGWTYNTQTSVFSQITDPAFPISTNSVFLAQYTIVGRAGTGQFWWSDIANPTVWNGLSFATAEGSPDNLVAVATVNSELWLFGERTTEIWANTGNFDLPFQRIGSAFMEQGLAAKHSVANRNNHLYWLSDDRIVFTNQGYSARKLSTFAMENEWQSYDDVSDAIGFTYQQEGHYFYCLTFPTQKKTWVYDLATDLWHERESMDSRWVANNIVEMRNAVYCGDYKTGNIYKVDLNVYSEAGDLIKRSNTFAPMFNEGKRLLFSKLLIDIQAGQGLEDNLDPQVILDWSDDGGMTFGNELKSSIGKVGEYLTRAVFFRLGQSRQRVFRIKFYDPIKIGVIGGYAEVVSE